MSFMNHKKTLMRAMSFITHVKVMSDGHEFQYLSKK